MIFEDKDTSASSLQSMERYLDGFQFEEKGFVETAIAEEKKEDSLLDSDMFFEIVKSENEGGERGMVAKMKDTNIGKMRVQRTRSVPGRDKPIFTQT